MGYGTWDPTLAQKKGLSWVHLCTQQVTVLTQRPKDLGGARNRMGIRSDEMPVM